MEDCDTLLMVGTSFPYIEFLPSPGQARAVQIELDPMRLGLRYPVEVGLVGDSRATLAALLPLLQPQTDRGFLEQAQERMADWRGLMEERGSRMDQPMKPQVVAWELGQRLASDAIVCCDSGTIATWWARHIPARRGQLHSVSGTLASDGLRAPLRDRGADRVPGAPGGGLRRRRRLLDADGRVRDLREVPAAGQGRGREEQHARADQVGADGLPRQPRVRLRSPPDRLRPLRRGLRRDRLHGRGPGRVRRRPGRARSPPRGRWSSRPSWIPSSRRCRPRSRSSRRRTSRSR